MQARHDSAPTAALLLTLHRRFRHVAGASSSSDSPSPSQHSTEHPTTASLSATPTLPTNTTNPPQNSLSPLEACLAAEAFSDALVRLLVYHVHRFAPRLEELEYVGYLGRGAYGVVATYQTKLGGDLVAVKKLERARIVYQYQVDQIMCEKRVLKKLAVEEHPHVVRLLSTDKDDGHLYFVFEHLSGGSLLDLIEAAPGGLDIGTLGRVTVEVAAALGFLHAQGVFHRDVKPENVLFDANGRVRLVDFGHAREFGDGVEACSERSGTRHYMAPETLQEQPQGPAADWWALGVLLYHMATGEPPFWSPDRSENIRSILHDEPDLSRGCIPQHVALSNIIKALLIKDPTRRLKSTSMIRRALSSL